MLHLPPPVMAPHTSKEQRRASAHHFRMSKSASSKPRSSVSSSIHPASPSSSSMSLSMSPPTPDLLSNRKSSSRARGPAPKIVVKKEPTSPDLTTSRHRPRRLDLSANNIVHSSGALTARPSGPMSSKDSASIQDVGLACLSPGFHTQDPTMREQLQRRIDVRERQRQIIEARQKNGGKAPRDDNQSRHSDVTPSQRSMKTPTPPRRKGPPPGLSIAPPAHQQFANERVIQSAPINQSFTGLRNNLPPSRHVANGPSNL